MFKMEVKHEMKCEQKDTNNISCYSNMLVFEDAKNDDVEETDEDQQRMTVEEENVQFRDIILYEENMRKANKSPAPIVIDDSDDDMCISPALSTDRVEEGNITLPDPAKVNDKSGERSIITLNAEKCKANRVMNTVASTGQLDVNTVTRFYLDESGALRPLAKSVNKTLQNISTVANLRVNNIVGSNPGIIDASTRKTSVAVIPELKNGQVLTPNMMGAVACVPNMTDELTQDDVCEVICVSDITDTSPTEKNSRAESQKLVQDKPRVLPPNIELPRKTMLLETNAPLRKQIAPLHMISPIQEVFAPHKTYPQGTNVPSCTTPRKTITPPRKTITPPRKTITPPRNTITPPRNTITPPRNTITPPRENCEIQHEIDTEWELLEKMCEKEQQRAQRPGSLLPEKGHDPIALRDKQEVSQQKSARILSLKRVSGSVLTQNNEFNATQLTLSPDPVSVETQLNPVRQGAVNHDSTHFEVPVVGRRPNRVYRGPVNRTSAQLNVPPRGTDTSMRKKFAKERKTDVLKWDNKRVKYLRRVPCLPTRSLQLAFSRSQSAAEPESDGFQHYKAATVTDDLQLTDSDSDIDDDDDINAFPFLTTCDATTEFPSESDLTPSQTQVLLSEDLKNDQMILELAPKYCFEFNWTDYCSAFTGQRDVFTGCPGSTIPVTNGTSVVNVFDNMFDVNFIDLLCNETNKYAAKIINSLKSQNKLLPNSRFHLWKPTYRNEMVSFLVVIILQGVYPLPSEKGYFTFNGFGTLKYFSRIMSLNRYLLLKDFLHFTDTTNKSKLCKIRPIIDYFNAKFSSLYYPSQEIVIDETLLKRRGRLSFAQKIQSQSTKADLKIYELSDTSSGYLWKFFVKEKQTEAAIDTNDVASNMKDKTFDRLATYGTEIVPVAIPRQAGRQTRDRKTDIPASGTLAGQIISNDDRTHDATAKIVIDLMKPLLHRGHTLVIDKFYNSPLLARWLKRQKTDCYGTLRINRDYLSRGMKALTKTDLYIGETVASYCTDLSVMAWRDTTLVGMISTYHQLQSTIQVDSNLNDKPQIVRDYNKAMSGIDRKEQLLAAQPLERVRNRCWYKKLFRRIFNAALYNCFVIYTTQHKNVTHTQFRTKLAEVLLKRQRHIDLSSEHRLSARIRTSETMPQLFILRKRHRPMVESDHFPVPTRRMATCYWCAMNKRDSHTCWKCSECNLDLCIECFRPYHRY